MRERQSIVYRGANLSGATAGVAHIPILTPAGQIIAVTVNVKTNVSGANAVFAVKKNGVVVNDLAVTILTGSSIGIVLSTAENITQGDDIVLDLVSGAVESPVAFSIVVDDGEAVVPEGGTTGQVMTKLSNDDYDADWQDGVSPVNIQTFTASGTWTKPAGAKAVEVFLIGGGGGGGAGRKGAAAGLRSGGAGGASGSGAVGSFLAESLGATETVTVGAGGVGSSSVTADSTGGAQGGSGGNTSFGNWLVALGGNGGNGGSTSSTVTGGAVKSSFNIPNGSAGANGAGTAQAQTSTDSVFLGTGGGGGGAINASDGIIGCSAAGDIKSSATASGYNSTVAGGTAGTAGGGGGNGNPTALNAFFGGTGGGGGASSKTANAGSGGSGGSYGGGGGGGGASLNAVGNSGAGGNGGGGIAVIVTYF